MPSVTYGAECQPPQDKDVKSLRTWAIQARGLPTYGINREVVFAILPHEADPFISVRLGTARKVGYRNMGLCLHVTKGTPPHEADAGQSLRGNTAQLEQMESGPGTPTPGPGHSGKMGSALRRLQPHGAYNNTRLRR